MDIALILTKEYPGAEWSLNGDSYSGLVWMSEDITKPTEEELSAAWDTVKYNSEVETIQGLRKVAYQNESDPIFFDWQRGEVTEQEWLDAVQAIKDRYPYPVVEEEGS